MKQGLSLNDSQSRMYEAIRSRSRRNGTLPVHELGMLHSLKDWGDLFALCGLGLITIRGGFGVDHQPMSISCRNVLKGNQFKHRFMVMKRRLRKARLPMASVCV